MEKTIKIMHVLNTGMYSGAENVVITLIKGMSDTVEGFYVSPDGLIRKILEENQIPFSPVHSTSVNAKELQRVIKEISPDIIHTHDFNAGVATVLTGTSIPIINHLHSNTPWLKKYCIKSLVYGISCLKYKKILTVSDSIKNEFVFGKLIERKQCMVGNPINIQSIRERTKSGSCETQYDIAFLGRLSPPKNPLMFLDIISDLSCRISHIKVAMIGDGEMKDQVIQKIHENKLDDIITVFGFQSNPYIILKSAKILCMPSLWEGFGLAAVESLALGLPVAASPVGGLKNIIDDTCGRLCTTKEEYVQNLEIWLSDDEKYDSLSCGALKKAQDLDNLDDYFKMIEKIYKEVLCEDI